MSPAISSSTSADVRSSRHRSPPFELRPSTSAAPSTPTSTTASTTSSQLATSIFEQLRKEWDEFGPSSAQLWPEHFDLAFDVAYGEPSDTKRINVGASPGDAGHADPYFYVGPWTDERPGDGEYWNAGFGATLSHADVVAAGRKPAQRDLVLDFLRTGMERLRAG